MFHPNGYFHVTICLTGIPAFVESGSFTFVESGSITLVERSIHYIFQIAAGFETCLIITPFFGPEVILFGFLQFNDETLTVYSCAEQVKNSVAVFIGLTSLKVKGRG